QRRDEAITAPGHGRNIFGGLARVTECATDGRHRLGEVVLLDDEARPYGRQQLVLADDAVPVADQVLEHVERPPGEREQATSLVGEAPAGGVEPEPSEPTGGRRGCFG